MIHVYAYLTAIVVAIIALFFSRYFMTCIGMSANWLTNLAAFLYSVSALFAVMEVFALVRPQEFSPHYAVVSFFLFGIVFHLIVWGLHTRTRIPTQ